MDKVTAIRTNFDSGKLSGASLQRSDLSYANFSHSVANSAHFSGANLTHTHFSKANIENASFVQSHFGSTVMNLARAHGAGFWPSNFAKDSTAVNGLYERVHAHINAAGDQVGFCSTSEHAPSGINAGLKSGHCTGTAVHGGSHGFYHSARYRSGWEWLVTSHHREVTVHGTDGVRLTGLMDGNWGAFVVNHVHGWIVGLTAHDDAVGQLGGPLAVNLEHRVFHVNLAVRDYGFTMVIAGWLPRKPCESHPGLCG